MDNNIEIRRLTPADATETAALHYQSFKGFFLTSLGLPFLRAFYSSIFNHADGLSIGAFSAGELKGFAVGTYKSQGFYKSILRSRSIQLLWAALLKLLFNPRNVKRLFTSLTSGSNTKYSLLPVLLSICVAEETKGLGRKLLLEFENELKHTGAKALTLTTDKEDNVYVNQFYLKNGYVCLETFFQGGRAMNLYLKKLCL